MPSRARSRVLGGARVDGCRVRVSWALALWLGALLLSQELSAGTIVGSRHDFRGSGWSGGRICVVCHTPHVAAPPVTAAPLWNHTLTSLTFTTYNSPTLDAVPGQPDGASKLCLSCHDGSVALDSFGGRMGSSFLVNKTAVGRLGRLHDDHPVSMTYDTTLSTVDAGLHDPASRVVTIGAGTRRRTGTVAALLLSGGKVQCSSCHDVHRNVSVGSGGGRPLLKITKFGSALCLACHRK